MIKVYYSGMYKEVDIRGSTQDFIDFVKVIRGKGVILIPTAEESPDPYDIFISTVCVENNSQEKAQIFVQDNKLVIKGSASSTDKVLEQIESFGKEASNGSHDHMSGYEGHPYLSIDSFEVTLSHKE